MNKRKRTSIDKAVVNVWNREVGELSTRNFAHLLGGSEDLVLRLDMYRKLLKHKGCVNTVSFNADGDILVSGSDDKRVILWDWETGNIKLSFPSGHQNNVFQAMIMPYSNDRSIVTSAADGKVRHAQILERGCVDTKLLGRHQGQVHKLAIEPGSPHIFYTCGEDGLVQHFDLRTSAATELFICQPIDDRRSYMPVVQLNTIGIDPRNPNLFAIAGTDEYTRLYDIRKYKWDGSTSFGQPANYFCPPHLIDDEQVGITGLAFSEQSELLVSYNDEFIYLFTKDMGLGPNPIPESPTSMNSSDESAWGVDHFSEASLPSTDTNEKVTPQVYKGHRNRETVKGVNFLGPKCEYVVSGSDCGRIFIWKKKSGELIRVMEADRNVVNCIESHPHTMVLASSGIDNDIKIWTPKALERATLPTNIEKKPKARGWMYRMSSPQDLMLQLFSLQRQRTSPEHSGENSTADQELLELILTFNANSDGSDDDRGDAASVDDFFS
ncbi:DDB1- and CUL4-associated factor 8-like [Quillaja saponaria]|uniref:DDB1- and CUL4-associated factor 8-like n=1 Tax=Quillaja saponaria TaxID=32244 RepID=A0AAD7QBV1_QUISA|nr:DDB1- and CUL4-associated factor 8-like [Quillaja saponaria]